MKLIKAIAVPSAMFALERKKPNRIKVKIFCRLDFNLQSKIIKMQTGQRCATVAVMKASEARCAGNAKLETPIEENIIAAKIESYEDNRDRNKSKPANVATPIKRVDTTAKTE